MTGHAPGKKMYKACKPLGLRSNLDFLSELPCGQCPVMQHCSDGGVISPSTCTYYSRWLAAALESQQGQSTSSATANSDTNMLAW